MGTYDRAIDAAMNGDLDTLKNMYDEGYLICDDVLGYAARSGRWQILEWALENRFYLGAQACAAAAEHGNFDLLRRLVEAGNEMDQNTTAGAAVNGHYDILLWTLENGCNITHNVKYYCQLRAYKLPQQLKEHLQF